MHDLTTERAQYIVKTVAPGYELGSVESAFGSFTNDTRILDCRTPAGSHVRFAVKFMVDKPDLAPRIATAHFHALGLARAHGVPVPEPIYLDDLGSVLGVPGIVTRHVVGRQEADPQDPVKWANTLADILLRIHDIRLSDEDRMTLIDGVQDFLYFLEGDWPQRMSGHPLSTVIFDALRERKSAIVLDTSRFVHMDYWHGNVLWHENRVAAVLDWDFAGFGDPAIDVAFFRMNMYLRGIKAAADIFLKHYEAGSGARVQNLGFWELAAAAHPLPAPALWIPASREMGDAAATDERAATDYYDFVYSARRRACEGK